MSTLITTRTPPPLNNSDLNPTRQNSEPNGWMKFTRSSLDLYRRLFLASPDIFCVVDHSCLVRQLNPAWTQVLGYSADECVGQPLTSFMHPEDRDRSCSILRSAKESGIVKDLEVRCVAKDGQIRYLAWDIAFSETDQIFFGVARDITERRRLREENERSLALVQQSERKYREVIESLSEIVVILEPNGVITYASPRMHDTLGHDTSACVGRSYDWLIHPDDLSLVHGVITESIATRQIRRCDRYRVRHANGEWRWLSGQVSCLTDVSGTPIQLIVATYDSYKFPLVDKDGRIYAIAGISVDIQDKVDALQQLESERMKVFHASTLTALGEMAGGIAHEVNNPLAIIHALADRIRESADSGAVDLKLISDTAARIESTTMRISKIIAGLRTIARDGTHEPPATALLREIVDDVFGLCAAKISGSGVRVEFVGNLDISLMCRRVQLSQVLLNLISNAFQAIEQSAQSSTQSSAEPLAERHQDAWIKLEGFQQGELFVLRVQDSGPGIADELKGKIFEPFFTTKEIGVGTGLGLSISRTIVEAHGGRLYLAPDARHTTFVIEIPQNAAGEAAA